MNKWGIIGVLVLLLAVGGFFFLKASPAAAALVYIERGTVEVDLGNGWTAASDEMEIKQGTKVRTTDGEATVVLLEGELIHLEPNTEISLDSIGKNIKISQAAGETWNKVTKISGVRDYSVETPNTVATVRGTEFIINDDEITVDEGEVDYADKNDLTRKVRVHAQKRALRAMMKEEAITEEQRARHARFKEKFVNTLKRVRLREVRKHQKILSIAEERGYSEDQIRQKLTDMDEGREDVERVYDEVPTVMKRKAERTYKITKAIRRAHERRGSLDGIRDDVTRELRNQQDAPPDERVVVTEREVMPESAEKLPRVEDMHETAIIADEKEVNHRDQLEEPGDARVDESTLVRDLPNEE